MDVSDPILHDALSERIEEHPGVHRAAADETPAVVIVDQSKHVLETGNSQVLIISDELDAALPPNADPDLILAAAHVMAAGYEITSGAGETAIPAVTLGQESDRETSIALTPREHDVVNLLVEGASNKHIARALGITERTAKFHVRAVTQKLHARNRSEVVAIALRDGLVAF